MRSAAWVEFEKRFGARIIEFYGMVDSPGLLLNDTGRIGSMGKPVGGVEFRVVDDNDRPLPVVKLANSRFVIPRGNSRTITSCPMRPHRRIAADGSTPATSQRSTRRDCSTSAGARKPR